MAVPGARRMRSNTFSLGVVSAVALALTSCGSDDSPDLRCVDTRTFKTVSDRLCDDQPGDGYAATDRYQWHEDYDSTSTSSSSTTGGSHHSYSHRYTGPKVSKGSGFHWGGFGGRGHSGS